MTLISILKFILKMNKDFDVILWTKYLNTQAAAEFKANVGALYSF